MTDEGKTVFISHSSKDRKFVHRLAKDLSACGIKPWVDETEILLGDSIFQRISEALVKADCVIVVLSRVSVDSPWVMREISAAINRNPVGARRALIPVIIDHIEVPILLRDIAYVDLTKVPYLQGLRKITQAILSTPDAETPTPVQLLDAYPDEIATMNGGASQDALGEQAEAVTNHSVPMDERLDLSFFMVGGTSSHYRTCRKSGPFSDRFSPVVFDPQFDKFVPTPEFGDTKSAISFETDVYSHSTSREDFNAFLRNLEQSISRVAADARIWDRRFPMYWSLSRDTDMDYGVGAENALLAIHAKGEVS